MVFEIRGGTPAAIKKAKEFMDDQFDELNHRCGWGQDGAEDEELANTSIEFVELWERS